MIRDFLNKVHGSGVVCANLRGQKGIPYLSEEGLWALRDARLRQIVKYAADIVPYYQNLFRKEGIDPRSIKTVHDLRLIPLAEKPTVRKNPSLFISTSTRGKNALWAYPTVLKALLCRVNYHLGTVTCQRMLITSAEVCDDMLKARTQGNLIIEMLNFYGANEVGRIAGECLAHERLHVNEDHVILECVNSRHPAEPGVSGEAFVTSLNALAQPFIRYRLGDVCKFTEKPCSCGSPFPLISPPLGRLDDAVKLPSGKIVSLWPFTFLLRKLNRLEQYRIIQESGEHLVVELAFRGDPSDAALMQLRSRLMEHLGEPVRVDIQCVDGIRDETPKFRALFPSCPVRVALSA